MSRPALEIDRYPRTDSEEEIVTLTCKAGHQWERPRPRKGRWPSTCPRHRRFFLEQLSGRVSPSIEIRKEWEQHAKHLGNPRYFTEWLKLWVDTTRLLAAKGDSWNAVNVQDVKEYVQAVRMAEVHRVHAEDEPYITTSHGKIQQHPGFALHEKEKAKAEAIALRMGLPTNTGHVDTGRTMAPPTKRTVDDGYQSRLQESAAEVEGEIAEVTGPDGYVL